MNLDCRFSIRIEYCLPGIAKYFGVQNESNPGLQLQFYHCFGETNRAGNYSIWFPNYLTVGRANVARRLTKRLLARRGFTRSNVNREGKKVKAKSNKSFIYVLLHTLNGGITTLITFLKFYEFTWEHKCHCFFETYRVIC